jgi:hypothetical protein
VDVRPRVYIETTIPSYLTARPSRDAVRLGREIETREWWDTRRADFDLVTSIFVLDECRRGDPTRAADRLALLANMPLLDPGPPVVRLAAELVRTMQLPPTAADAAHVAVAAVHAVDYLLTWNCTHLANAALWGRIRTTCAAAGCRPPVICTPSQLLAGQP